MKKKTKDWIKVVSLLPVVLLSPLIVIVLLLLVLFGTAFIAGEIQHYEIRGEVFQYVEDHKESIAVKNPENTQYFIYSEWGFVDAGVIYGYFYSPEDERTDYCEEYRDGFRYETPTRYGDGWVYFEEICDNWYYYEEHYG